MEKSMSSKHKVGSPGVSEKAVDFGGRAVLVGVEEIVPEGTTSVVSVSWRMWCSTQRQYVTRLTESHALSNEQSLTYVLSVEKFCMTFALCLSAPSPFLTASTSTL